MSETSDLNKFLAWCEDLGTRLHQPVWAVRVHSGRVAVRGGRMQLAPTGTPDAFLLVNGHPLWVEGKAPKKKPTEAQLECHKRIRASGGVVLVVDDWKALRRYVLDLLRGHRGMRGKVGSV